MNKYWEMWKIDQKKEIWEKGTGQDRTDGTTNGTGKKSTPKAFATRAKKKSTRCSHIDRLHFMAVHIFLLTHLSTFYVT